MSRQELLTKIEAVYRWIDAEVDRLGSSCRACGQCCDFETFGHRLYVTTPELVYFDHFMGSAIKPMTDGVCPYRIDGKCSVYPYRFAGCRIFTCGGDSEAENRLSEQAVHQFKALCEPYAVAYRYVYLKEGLAILNEPGAGELLSAEQ